MNRIIKGILFFLIACLSIVSIPACNSREVQYDPDVWNGEIADHFAGGDGSKTSPYQIQTAAQLAFLAQEINSGKDYKGKFFSLLRDLDLNNIEWTPIGNGDHTFEGTFDGKDHTISNLKISNVVGYEIKINGHSSYTGIAGLFGYCCDASFYNLTIQKASVSADNVDSYDYLYAGVLAARLETQSSDIFNIKVCNSQILVEHDTKLSDNCLLRSLAIGGLFGSIKVKESSQCSMDRVAGDITVNIKNLYRTENAIGGIAGIVINQASFATSNFSSCVKAHLLTNIEKNNIGAFGNIGNLVDCHTKLSHAFSRIEINHKVEDIHPLFDKENAIIGSVNQIKDAGGNIGDASFEFDHLFGYVELTDIATSHCEQRYRLYVMPEYVQAEHIKENTCQGCKKLPENHTFDKKVWDLSDLSEPKLK